MNTYLKYTLTVLLTITFLACSKDDDSSDIPEEGFSEVELFFDNGVNGDQLILGNSYTNSLGESLTIDRLNYIVSNIVLIKEDGSEFVYPKEDSYFLVLQEAEVFSIHLENIPTGDYSKIRFGVGVDQERYLEGETAQQEFWDYASQHNMVWTWSTGYRFINFEGSFSNDDVENIPFKVHQGSNTATDNYREVTLDLPTTARVRVDEVPNIHVVSDINTILDGTNKISLYENLNPAGTESSIMGGEALIDIAENTLSMFVVDHVHNGSGSHH